MKVLCLKLQSVAVSGREYRVLCRRKTYDGNTVGNMVKTTNGGETWTSLKMKMSQITAFHFLDANNGFVFNFNQELWKTTDGGTS